MGAKAVKTSLEERMEQHRVAIRLLKHRVDALEDDLPDEAVAHHEVANWRGSDRMPKTEEGQPVLAQYKNADGLECMASAVKIAGRWFLLDGFAEIHVQQYRTLPED